MTDDDDEGARTTRLRAPGEAPPVADTDPATSRIPSDAVTIERPAARSPTVGPPPPVAGVPTRAPGPSGSRSGVAVADGSPVAAPVARTVTVLGLLAVVGGLVWSALPVATSTPDWIDAVAIPAAGLGVATTAAGRGGIAIATGVLTVAMHGETWIATLRDTIADALRAGDVGVLLDMLLPDRGAPLSLVVVGALIAISGGVRVVSARARNQGRRSAVG